MTAAAQVDRDERGAAANALPRCFISVMIPVRNEERHIAGTLSQLIAQDYDPSHFEILVIDGESDDRTAEIVREFAGRHPHVRLLTNPRRLSSAARNVAVRAARGDVLLLVDGHCELANDQLLKNVARAFEASGADCLGRPQPLNVQDAKPLQQAIAAARASWLGHHPDSFIYASEARRVPAISVAAAYRSRVFRQVGEFDERFDACEDVEFNHRVDEAGLSCYFAPELAVRYYPRESLCGLFHQLVRYGRGRVRLLRKHPKTFSLMTFVPAVFVVGLVVGLAASWFSPVMRMAYLAVLGAYALTVILAALQSARRLATWRAVCWLGLVFLTIHIASGVGILRELLFGKRFKERS